MTKKMALNIALWRLVDAVRTGATDTDVCDLAHEIGIALTPRLPPSPTLTAAPVTATPLPVVSTPYPTHKEISSKKFKGSFPLPAVAADGTPPMASAYRIPSTEIRAGVCMGRLFHGDDWSKDKRWLPRIFREFQCGRACVSGTDLCKGCTERRARWSSVAAVDHVAQENTWWNGYIHQEIPAYTHMLGTAWAVRVAPKWKGIAVDRSGRPDGSDSESGSAVTFAPHPPVAAGGGAAAPSIEEVSLMTIDGKSYFIHKNKVYAYDGTTDNNKIYDYDGATDAPGDYVGRLQGGKLVKDIPEADLRSLIERKDTEALARLNCQSLRDVWCLVRGKPTGMRTSGPLSTKEKLRDWIVTNW